MESQNPKAKTLFEASDGSSAFYTVSEGVSAAASSMEVQGLENVGASDGKAGVADAEHCKGEDCLKGEKSSGNANAVDANDNHSSVAGNVVSKSLPTDRENVLDKYHGADSMRKIEVSWDKLFLVVDFSGCLTAAKQGSNSLPEDMHEECKFSKGDLVWVKTGSHNWWPGRVDDPSSAANLAAKTDHDNMLPISCFHQKRVAWCFLPQLKPFHKYFEHMVEQSNSKSFHKAVEEALKDFGEHLRLKMLCSCFREDNENVVCDSGAYLEFSLAWFDPKEFLSQLKCLARGAPAPGMLASTVMQARVSAFYHSIFHPQVPLKQLCDASEETVNPVGKISRKESEAISAPKNHVNCMILKRRREQVAKNRDEGDEVENFEDITLISLCSKAPELRERKKSKRLSYPCVDARRNAVRSETDDEASLRSSDSCTRQLPFGGSPSSGIGSAKRFQTMWFQKFISKADSSAKTNLEMASTQELLSELRVMAMDCRYTKEIKTFDLIEWFFSKFRILMYHDELIYEEQCKRIMSGQRAGAENDFKNLSKSPDAMDQEQTTKKKKSQKQATPGMLGVNMKVDSNNMTNIKLQQLCLERIHQSPDHKDQVRKTEMENEKVMPGLLGVNVNVDGIALPGSSSHHVDQEQKVKNGKKMAKADLSGLNSNVDGSALHERESEQMCLRDICKSLGHTDVKQKIERKRKKVMAGLVDVNITIDENNLPEKHSQVMFPKTLNQAGIIPDLNSASTALNFAAGSLKSPLDHSSDRTNAIFESLPRLNGENVQSGSMINFQATGLCGINSVPCPGDVNDIAFTHDSNILPDGMASERQKRRGRRKQGTIVEPTLPGAIPDLNGTGAEQSALSKDVPDMNSIPPESKQKPKRQRRGKDAGTILLLNFAPGISIPSKEDLVSNFSTFGPLNPTETQVLDDSGSARISFLSTNDAVEAFRSLKLHNPFGESLEGYRLQPKPTVRSPATATKPRNSFPRPPPQVAQPPQLDMMRQSLMMMRSMLEKAGDSLSPEMRVKLESEIRGVLEKISSMSSSSKS